MTIKDLKEMIADLPDDSPVLRQISETIFGNWYGSASPRVTGINRRQVMGKYMLKRDGKKKALVVG